MGGCAGCMGPSRRDQNYRVNRLTENAIIKSRVSSELPVSKHQKKIVEQLNQEKRRIDQNSLIGLLVSSPEMNSSFHKQAKFSSSQVHRESNQSPFLKQNYQNSSIILPKSIRRIQSSIINDHSIGVNNSFHFSNQKNYAAENKSPFVSDFRVGTFSRQMSKIPLSQVGSNRHTNDMSLQLKKRSLLGIPQIPEEQSKTPVYIYQERKKNGQDVLKTGLDGIPSKLESAPNANLFRYLKDLT